MTEGSDYFSGPRGKDEPDSGAPTRQQSPPTRAVPRESPFQGSQKRKADISVSRFVAGETAEAPGLHATSTEINLRVLSAGSPPVQLS